ncbi:hypothetical protein SCANM63S_06301 [Streptomyces canarius]
MLSQASICAPVRASVSTVRATGLPSESRPTASVRQASFGLPCRASTTSTGLALACFSVVPRLAARRALTARPAALGPETRGVTEGTETACRVARSAPR